MRSRRWLLGLALLVHFPAAAAGQSADRWRDSSRALEAAIRAINDSLVHGDTNVTDVARQGDLVIAASPDERADAQRALASFVTGSARWFGASRPSADGFRITIHVDQGRARFGARATSMVVLAGMPDTGRSTHTERTVSVGDDLRDPMLDQYGHLMFASAPADLNRWLTGPPDLSRAESSDRDIAMYALITGTGAAQRHCVTGDNSACAVALNLRAGQGAISGGAYAPFMRTDLLFVAMRLGGGAGWQRLPAAGDSGVDAEITALAGRPTDSVIAQWRSELLARKPASDPTIPGGVVVVAGWLVAALVLALGGARWA
jgi:hypothetical protein